MTLADGDSFALSQLRGRYVLLDFWGSWCGPCRKESPELTALYKETKDKTYINASGFDIVSVAIETKKKTGTMPDKKMDMYGNFRSVNLIDFQVR